MTIGQVAVEDKSELHPENSRGKIGTKTSHWFARGFFTGAMLVAALNAASFLWRSPSIAHLFDGNVASGAALGFPLEVWNYSNTYGGAFIDLIAFGINALVACGLGLVLGLFAISQKQRLNQWVAEFEAESEARSAGGAPLQFSIVSLLGATSLVAVLAGAVTQWAGTRELLWFIYLFGPATLIGISFLPRNIRWQSRCVILTIAATIVIGGAVWSGHIRGVEFDKILMGIYVFWTPQGAFAAFAMMVGMFLFKRFK